MAGNKVESIHKQGVYALSTHYGNAVNGVFISTEFVFPAINGWAMQFIVFFTFILLIYRNISRLRSEKCL